MRKLFIVLGIALCVLQVAEAQVRYGVNAGQGVQIDYSNPKVFEIADIKFTGLNVLEERALISFTGIKVGDRIPIPGNEISSAIKKLWKQGIIANVEFWLTKIEGDRAYLEVRLTERPRVLSFDIEGVNSTQRSDIMDQVGIVGKVASAPLIKNTELLITKYFIDKGYLNVAVNTTQESDTLVSDGIRMTSVVEKNGKVKINKIDFEGNETFSRARLKKTLRNTHEKPRFWLISALFDQVFKTRPKTIVNYVDSSYVVSKRDFKAILSDNVKLNFLQSSKFIRSDFNDDKDALVAFYNSKGYRDAFVVSDSVSNLNKDFINVDITVDEGNKYYIRDIDWVGNFKYTDAELTEKLGIEKGDVYDQQKLDQRTQFDGEGGDAINSLYMDDG